MPPMGRTVLWRAAAVQALGVLVLSLALGLTLPHSFFEDWGWLAGPGAWAVCALVTARVAGLPSLLAVIVGVHWLGAVLAIALFALWCARLARERGLTPHAP